MQATQIMERFARYGLSLKFEQAQKLEDYYKILVEENKRLNLTRLVAPDEVLEEHFLDSILPLSRGIEFTGKDLLDLGSGAGFPGIPLKLFLPGINIILLEASRKKVIFLQKVVRELKLKDVVVLHGRAEDFGRKEGRERFYWVTARALAPLVVAVELALPLLKTGGFFWAYKGPACKKELEESKKIIHLCGGSPFKTVDYSIWNGKKKRTVLVIKKVRVTPQNFPRKAGIVQKRPYK